MHRIGALFNLNGATQYALESAVDEVYSNIIEHAYQGSPGWVRFRVYKSPQRLTLIFNDRGRGYDPVSGQLDPNRLVLEGKEHGLGLHLVYSLMDEVRYIRRKQSNEHILVKRLGGKDA
jgi:anti-sigma regulatory factor (Ser/Thr protein kinase)